MYMSVPRIMIGSFSRYLNQCCVIANEVLTKKIMIIMIIEIWIKIQKRNVRHLFDTQYVKDSWSPGAINLIHYYVYPLTDQRITCCGWSHCGQSHSCSAFSNTTDAMRNIYWLQKYLTYLHQTQYSGYAHNNVHVYINSNFVKQCGNKLRSNRLRQV